MKMKGLKDLEIQLPEIQMRYGDMNFFRDEDPRVRRQPFSWRMFLLILLVLWYLLGHVL